MAESPRSISVFFYDTARDAIDDDFFRFFILARKEERTHGLLLDVFDLTSLRFHHSKEFHQLVEVILPGTIDVEGGFCYRWKLLESFTHFLPLLVFDCLLPLLKLLLQDLWFHFLFRRHFIRLFCRLFFRVSVSTTTRIYFFDYNWLVFKLFNLIVVFCFLRKVFYTNFTSTLIN